MQEEADNSRNSPPLPENPALFLDFDGTLVPFAQEPDGIVVSQDLLDLLDRLHGLLGGALAMVTGRGVDNLSKHLGHTRFAAAGVHGAEWRLAGERLQHVAGEEFDDLLAAVQEFAEDHEGIVAEEKSGGGTLHFRQRPDLREAAHDVLERALANRDDFEILPGNMMWEARRKGVHKGAAIGNLMQHPPFWGRMPVSIGDDVTDEDGFAAVQQVGGMAVKVGKGETCARYRLANIAAVHDWLGRLADKAERNAP